MCWLSTGSESSTPWSASPSIFFLPQFSYEAELSLSRAMQLTGISVHCLFQILTWSRTFLRASCKKFFSTNFMLLATTLTQMHRLTRLKLSNLKASLLNWERLRLWICWMEMQLEEQIGNLSHLRKLGCPEVMMNSVKHKPGGQIEPCPACCCRSLHLLPVFEREMWKFSDLK